MALINIRGLTISSKPRPDGRWQARYSRKGYQPLYCYGRTEQEVLIKAEIMVNNPKLVKKEKIGITLKDWLQQWLELYRKPEINVSTSTHLNNKYIISKYISANAIAEMQLNKIKAIDIQELLISIEADRPRKDTRMVLVLAFKKATGLHIKNNIMLEVENVYCEENEGIPLTIHQEKTFVEAIKGKAYELYYAVCLYTGARRGEALALTWEDIDIKNKLIRITKQVKEPKSKKKNTKTKGSVRFVPILPQLLTYLNNPGTGKLFKYGRERVTNLTREIFNSLDFPRELVLHSLRHTFGTRLAEKGIPDRIIAKWMGHTTTKTTQRYITTLPDYEIEMINKLSNSFDTNLTTITQENTEKDKD